MNDYALGGFEQFRCIAAACPDSCCVGWDVVIDDDSAERYRTMDTPLGERLRASMHIDEDGDTVFESVDGRCPFLRSDCLCEIQKQCGASALSVTCARFPRIVQEYDDFTERCLSLSCPEGARITLYSDRLTAPEPQTADSVLRALLAVRSRFIALVQDRSVPFGEALCRCLRYAEEMQDRLYEGTLCPEADFDVSFTTVPTGDASALVRFHGTLERMTQAFGTRCETAHSPRIGNRTLFENLAVYYLYRYTLQAVEDGDILSKVLLMLSAVTFAASTDGDPFDTARLYAKEVEHSYENMERMVEAFFENPAFFPEAFYALWGFVPCD